MRRINIDRREEEGKRDRREGRGKPSSREEIVSQRKQQRMKNKTEVE